MILNIRFVLKLNFKRLHNLRLRIANLFLKGEDRIPIEKIRRPKNPVFCWKPTLLLDGTKSWLELVDADTIAGSSKWNQFAVEADELREDTSLVHDERHIPIGELSLEATQGPLDSEEEELLKLSDDIAK